MPAELQEAIEISHNTSVGPDETLYEFLKHLPKNSLDYILTIFLLLFFFLFYQDCDFKQTSLFVKGVSSWCNG